MSVRPTQFNGREISDKVKEWLREMEKAFWIVEVPEHLWDMFGTYMLFGDAKNWWRTLLKIKYKGEELAWNEFVQQIQQAYIPQVAKERKMQEFLELGQKGKAMAKYAAQFHHLEKYYHHVFSTDQEHVGKFILGLDEGLRAKVINSDPEHC